MYEQSDFTQDYLAPAGSIVPRPRGGGAIGRPLAQPAYPRESDEGAQAIRATLANLYRAKWLILGIFLAIAAVALPTIWLAVKPKYRATAVVRVAPEDITIMHQVDAPGVGRYYPLYFATQIATMTNASVLQNALDRPEVQATGWYHQTDRSLKTLLGGSAPNNLERLANAIEVEQQGDTDLLNIHVDTASPQDAHVLANAVLEEYITYTKEKGQELEDLRFRTLREEHDAAVKEIEGLVEQRGELSKQLGADNPDAVRQRLIEDLADLEMERKQLNRKYQQMCFDQGVQEEAPAGEPTADPAEQANALALVYGASRYSADAEWRRRSLKVEAAEQAYREESQKYGDAHPRMQTLRSRLEAAQRNLAEREQELGPNFRPESAVQAPVAARDDAETSTAFLGQGALAFARAQVKRDLELLDAEIAKLRTEQEAKGELAKQVAQINDQLARKQGEEKAFYDRIQALTTEQKAPGRISVAAPAVPVSSPHRDKRLMLSVMSLAGALFFGVVVAHLRGNVNPKVFIADDVQRTARVPFLGQLPHSPSAGTLLNDPNLLLQECMRMVRTALLERMTSGGERAVMITSASSSAGKTTVAIELAKSLAHLGKRTLLVEADLRRPTLAKRLGINNEAGLCSLLDGTVTDDDAITPSGVPQLDLIFAGRRPPVLNPEVLANGVFAAALERWKHQYDFVLLDCPPILPVADARILARQVDGAIMVSRASHCRRSEVIQACADLTAAGGPLIGSVLVGVQPGSGYGYSYEYSYDATA